MPLKNNYSEDLELASLLVKIDVFPAKVPAGGWAGRAAPGWAAAEPCRCRRSRTATSALSGVRPCGSGAATPRAHCSTAGPGRAPSKLATSSPLRTSASPRSISQTILTVGIAGEGEVAWKRGPERLGGWPATLSSPRLPPRASTRRLSGCFSLLSRAPRRTRVNGDNRL